MPGITWEDIQIILYGAPNSIWFADDQPQGMEGDTAVYIQQAFDVPSLDARSNGQWRVFSKLGFGITRRGAEFVHNGYACLPHITESGAIKENHGKEFVLSFFMTSPAHEAAQGDAKVADIYKTVVARILDGRIR